MAEEQLNTDENCGTDLQIFTDFSAEVNLVTVGPTGKAPREITIVKAGIVEVITKHGTRTITAVQAGVLLGRGISIGALKLTTNTTGEVMAIW